MVIKILILVYMINIVCLSYALWTAPTMEEIDGEWVVTKPGKKIRNPFKKR